MTAPDDSAFISYAINAEDVVLWRALREVENGFYVDVGANDPDQYSVTRAFYERGWRGLNLEPLPEMHSRLVARRPRDVNLRIAAGRTAGEVELSDFPDRNGWATTNAAVAQAHLAAGLRVRRLPVTVRRLDDVLSEVGPAAIHLLKIDVEGNEGDVLAGLDLRRWRPWVLVIEATQPGRPEPAHRDWEPGVIESGYRYCLFDGLNRFYVAVERAELIDRLSVPANVFDGFIPSGLHQLQQAHAEQSRALAAERETSLKTGGDLHRQARSLRLERDLANRRAGELQRQIDSVRSSWSWRLTWPMRWLARGAPWGELRRQTGRAVVAMARRLRNSEAIRKYVVPVARRVPTLDRWIGKLAIATRAPESLVLRATGEPPASVSNPVSGSVPVQRLAAMLSRRDTRRYP